MAQPYKGPRDISTLKLPLELRERMERAASLHKYRQLGVYMADLIVALHPNPAKDPARAAAMHSVIPTLLRGTQISGGIRKSVTVRTPKGAKARIKAAYSDYDYPDMTAYLGTLLSALHPTDGGGGEAATASTLVGCLLAGDPISVSPAGNRIDEKQLSVLSSDVLAQHAA
ncbi:hypothetical protein [Nonomuraea jabiensis]|uniref:hypothetical protein n=1 Tax=Nonomuraea jabiensis TaxID=882448 RepID=UPI003D759873